MADLELRAQGPEEIDITATLAGANPGRMRPSVANELQIRMPGLPGLLHKRCLNTPYLKPCKYAPRAASSPPGVKLQPKGCFNQMSKSALLRHFFDTNARSGPTCQLSLRMTGLTPARPRF